MAQSKKKLANMVWRSMGEAMLFSLGLFAVLAYLLYYFDYITLSDGWGTVVGHGLLFMFLSIMIGAVYGYVQSSYTINRLRLLEETMMLLEKGHLNKAIPSLGEDEIGRLGERLNRISKKWEEQVSSLQRLSADNAQLAERSRYSAIAEERQRLARELHDAVSQQLFAISMTATAVGRTLERDFDKAKRQISLIEEMSSVAQSEMRALLLHLRPVMLKGKELTEAINDLVSELRAKVPMKIHLEVDDEVSLPKGIEDHLFRIIQEAMSNAMRHSQAERLDIRLLQREPGMVRLSIRDNGVGFDMTVEKLTSYGFVSMRERVNEIGGSIDIITAPGQGTRIEIRIPVINDEEEELNDDNTD